MKILQTIAGFGAHSGGTSTCTYDLLSAMHGMGCDVDLMTVKVKDPTDKLMGQGEEWIKALDNDCRTPYGWSPNMTHFLRASDHDIYHTNGMWMHCNHETCTIARQKGKPYVITPHGMLYPQALARSTWKKKLLLNLGGVEKDLRHATCIHATCDVEMKHYRALGYTNPVAIIPNPMPIPSFIDDIKSEKSIKRIGYLGRIHPYKNTEALINAWITLGDEVKDAQLIIMGRGDNEYEAKMHQLVARHNLTNVEFAGFVNGREKFERLASLTALCVPSITENFGMTVTEALSVGTPVIASLGTPWQELNTEHCGWWVDNDVETLADTISQALSLPQDEIEKMGNNGKRLVNDKYRDTQVAAKMKQLYGWILKGGVRPDFVYV